MCLTKHKNYNRVANWKSLIGINHKPWYFLGPHTHLLGISPSASTHQPGNPFWKSYRFNFFLLARKQAKANNIIKLKINQNSRAVPKTNLLVRNWIIKRNWTWWISSFKMRRTSFFEHFVFVFRSPQILISKLF